MPSSNFPITRDEETVATGIVFCLPVYRDAMALNPAYPVPFHVRLSSYRGSELIPKCVSSHNILLRTLPMPPIPYSTI